MTINASCFFFLSLVFLSLRLPAVMSQHPKKCHPKCFLMLLQELQRCYSEISHFHVSKRQKKREKVVMLVGVCDKTFMITRVLEDGHRAPYSARSVQLKPFYKLTLHVLWSLIFFLCPFPLPVEMGAFALLQPCTHRHTDTHNPPLSVSLATGTLVYFSISSASCSRNDRP